MSYIIYIPQCQQEDFEAWSTAGRWELQVPVISRGTPNSPYHNGYYAFDAFWVNEFTGSHGEVRVVRPWSTASRTETSTATRQPSQEHIPPWERETEEASWQAASREPVPDASSCCEILGDSNDTEAI